MSGGDQIVRQEGSRLVVQGPVALVGSSTFPGDKSISHRALFLAALAKGRSVLRGLSDGRDVAASLALVEALGAGVEVVSTDPLTVVVDSPGPEGLSAPNHVIDCGNSATTMRIGAGLVAGIPQLFALTGDASLRRRPMERVAEPLELMGAAVALSPGGTAPMVLKGARLRGIAYDLPVASAQVKSMVLLAGIQARGRTIVRERFLTREHTEAMLTHLGAPVDIQEDGGRVISVEPCDFSGFDADIPGDISSAAFFLAGAAAVPGSRFEAKDVILTPSRKAFLDVLEAMGAQVSIAVTRAFMGQEVGDVTVGHAAELKGVEIEPARVPSLIDELVCLAAVACTARGKTSIRGAGELRHKESDRISALARELVKCGAEVAELDDGLEIRGKGGFVEPAKYDSHGDHRIAMAAAILACAARGRSEIGGVEAASVSFPGFVQTLVSIGRVLPEVGGSPGLLAAGAGGRSEKSAGGEGVPELRSGGRPSLLVAIDGPAGSGKSTVARILARRLGLRYLDTGAFYRAVTLVARRRGIEPSEGAKLGSLAESLTFEVTQEGHLLVDGSDVTDELRSEEVESWVSVYSAVSEVREALVRKQREAAQGGAVMEGRDIGTVVLPDADLKVFLDASFAERLRRRSQADAEKRTPMEVAEAIRKRDELDSSRKDSPLKPAPDAVVIDTTDLSVDEVVARIEQELAKRGCLEKRSAR
jgi:3-phosphoshikimate 1-carboxyvinyltransferase